MSAVQSAKQRKSTIYTLMLAESLRAATPLLNDICLVANRLLAKLETK